MENLIRIVSIFCWFAGAAILAPLVFPGITRVNASETIQLPACKFSVRFPAKPTIQKLLIPAGDQTIPSTIALLKSTEHKGIFRHECVCVHGMNTGRIDRSLLRQRLTEYGKFNGFSNIGFTLIGFSDGKALELRGYKMIDNIPATFVARAFLTVDCFATVMVGSPSSSYPPDGGLEFLEGIRYTRIALPPEGNWVEFQKSPLGGRRFIDLNTVQIRDTVVSYRRKYVTSSGKSAVVTEGHIDCSTKRVRTSSATFFADDGSIQSSKEYSIDESPFMAATNDLSTRRLLTILCNGNIAAKPEEIRRRLQPLKAETVSNFINLSFPQGIDIAVPRNWYFLDENLRANLRSAAEATVRISGLTYPEGVETTLVAANGYSSSKFPSALMRLTVVAGKTVSQQEIQHLSQRNLLQVGQEARRMLELASAKAGDWQRVDWVGTKVEPHQGLAIVVHEYYRQPVGKDKVLVQMNILYLGNKEVKLTLSRVVTEKVWIPILKYIKLSWKVDAR